MSEFGTYFEPNWGLIAEDEDLGRPELRLLLLCVAHLGPQNVIPLLQVEMGRRLGVSRQAISQAMRVLVEKGLVFQEGRTYRMNSHLVMKEGLTGIGQLRREDAKRLRGLEGEAYGNERTEQGECLPRRDLC